MTERIGVMKTYKLYLGGDFPRSESGRSYEVNGADGGFLANAARASRKDIRDAVKAARKAWPGWAAATAYNRGQVLYRVAEMMETRRGDLEAEIARVEDDSRHPSPDGQGDAGSRMPRQAGQVDTAIDTFVYYAGWTDKITQVMGGLNPVAGPYFNITAPEPTGVVGIVAPEEPSLIALCSRIAPAMCGGNASIVLASERFPLPAIALAECLATADVPGGVVNILTGLKSELVPVLASHLDVDALDITGVTGDQRAEAERAAAENVKRVVTASDVRGPHEVTAFMDMKTVWHPKGR